MTVVILKLGMWVIPCYHRNTGSFIYFCMNDGWRFGNLTLQFLFAFLKGDTCTFVVLWNPLYSAMLPLVNWLSFSPSPPPSSPSCLDGFGGEIRRWEVNTVALCEGSCLCQHGYTNSVWSCLGNINLHIRYECARANTGAAGWTLLPVDAPVFRSLFCFCLSCTDLSPISFPLCLSATLISFLFPTALSFSHIYLFSALSSSVFVSPTPLQNSAPVQNQNIHENKHQAIVTLNCW